MQFFRYFPQIPYTFSTDAGQYQLRITNPTVRLKVMERLHQHVTVIHDYIVRDGERPDTVATLVYGSPSYTWLILLINNIMSLYDWPLTHTEFDGYITSKYGSVIAAQNQWVYYTADGYEVDPQTYNLLPAAERGTPVSRYDVEMRLNEAKRRIKIVPPEFAEPLAAELRSLL